MGVILLTILILAKCFHFAIKKQFVISISIMKKTRISAKVQPLRDVGTKKRDMKFVFALHYPGTNQNIKDKLIRRILMTG